MGGRRHGARSAAFRRACLYFATHLTIDIVVTPGNGDDSGMWFGIREHRVYITAGSCYGEQRFSLME